MPNNTHTLKNGAAENQIALELQRNVFNAPSTAFLYEIIHSHEMIEAKN